MSNLALCPFCGQRIPGEDAIVSGMAGSCTVQCDCGGQGPWRKTTDEAIAAWNRRAPALRWRREPPDVPGWWWVRDSQRISVQIIHCTDADCEWLRPRLARIPGEARLEWAGPIVEPE